MKPSGPDRSLNRLYYRSEAGGPPLRIGIMIDGTQAQLFMRRVMEDIQACNFAAIVACIVNKAVTPAAKPSAPASLPNRVSKALFDTERRRFLSYYAYMRTIDRRSRPVCDPYELVDCSDLLASAQRIEVAPLQKGFVDRFPADAIEQIKALDLDVILRFGFRIIRGEVLNAARYGVWSFHHGDSERYRGGPSMLWELIERNPLSGAVLQRLDESLDAGPILCRGILATCPSPSVSLNRYEVYWSTQHFVIKQLYALYRFGIEHLRSKEFRPAAYLGKRSPYRRPTNLDMARWMIPTIARTAVRRLMRRKEVVHWRVGLRRSTTPLYENPTADRLREFAWLDSPRGYFWADPFLIQEAGDTWMFFEEYSYATKHGAIACGRIENGELKDVRRVLDEPHHLSYPYVFRHAGEVWMIPESAQAGKVQLYRATRFPYEWQLECTLLDLCAVDCSIFEYRGRWWMFVSPLIVGGNVAATLLFVASRPQGPWTLHPADSICNDVRWARCAGSIIEDNGQLIRPSQDGSSNYGYSIGFNKVKLLDETRYEEERGLQLLPDPRQGIHGVHTYNRVGDWEVIDGRALQPAKRVK